MEVLRLSRSALKFPAQCLACGASPEGTLSWPKKRWRRKHRIDVPICRDCKLRLRLASVSMWPLAAVLGLAIGSSADGNPITLGGWSIWWALLLCFAAAIYMLTRVAGRLLRLPFVRVVGHEVELGFDDPVAAAEVIAASHAQPYRGTQPALLHRDYGWLARIRSSRWFARLNRPLW